VNHPGHYNIPGRKECIEEMLDLFGYEKVEAFCELNSYKYRYRHELKNGQEDLDKAKNYDQMWEKYTQENPFHRLAWEFGLGNRKNQLVEEMAELSQAFCKWNRFVSSDPSLAKKHTIESIRENIIEELADVKFVLDQVIYLMDVEEEIHNIMNMKADRTFERIGAKE
jgi:NTP pyrophosphatase (non-canonical NTP hydrolase)